MIRVTIYHTTRMMHLGCSVVSHWTLGSGRSVCGDSAARTAQKTSCYRSSKSWRKNAMNVHYLRRHTFQDGCCLEGITPQTWSTERDWKRRRSCDLLGHRATEALVKKPDRELGLRGDFHLIPTKCVAAARLRAEGKTQKVYWGAVAGKCRQELLRGI
jgi:hypothetical protein